MEPRAFEYHPFAVSWQATVAGDPGTNRLGIAVIVQSQCIALRGNEIADSQPGQHAQREQAYSHHAQCITEQSR